MKQVGIKIYHETKNSVQIVQFGQNTDIEDEYHFPAYRD